jgi:hypothetical protein
MTEIERLRDALRHAQGRFLNINICLSSGGSKREAITIADVGEDCIKMALARDSDGTATAAANGDLPVPQDCQARPEGIAK